MATKGVPSGRCTVCNHQERPRIDYAAARGAPINSLAERFGLGKDALHRHYANHVSDSFKKSAAASHQKAEELLRKEFADQAVSSFEIACAHTADLWSQHLLAMESGSTSAVATIARALTDNLVLRAKISKELQPAGPTAVSVTNYFGESQYQEIVTFLADLARRLPETSPMIMEFLRRPRLPLAIEGQARELADA